MIRWEMVGQYPVRELALAACLSDDAWVFRGTHSIFAWNSLRQRPNWQVELRNDRPTGIKLLACTTNFAISFADLGRKNGSQFVCVDRNSGHVVWQKALACSPKEFGLATVGSQIAIQAVSASGEPRLLILDSATGDVITDKPSVLGQYVVGFENRLFIGGQDGLYLVEVGQAGLRKLLNGAIHSLVAEREEIVFLLEEDERYKTVVRWNGIALQEQSRFQINANSAWVLPKLMPRSSRVALRLGERAGLGVFDFATGQSVWRAGQDKLWTIWKSEWTPAGLIVLAQTPDGERGVHLLSKEDGFILSSPETQYLPESIFWHEGRLIVSGLSAGMQAFALDG